MPDKNFKDHILSGFKPKCKPQITYGYSVKSYFYIRVDCVKPQLCSNYGKG